MRWLVPLLLTGCMHHTVTDQLGNPVAREMSKQAAGIAWACAYTNGHKSTFKICLVQHRGYLVALCEANGVKPDRVGGLYTPADGWVFVDTTQPQWRDILAHELLHVIGYTHETGRAEPLPFKRARADAMEYYYLSEGIPYTRKPID